MREELAKAIRATRGLTTDELGELRTHIGALISLGPGSADRITSSTNHDDWVLMGLVDYARHVGLEHAFVVTLTNRKDYDSFREKLPAIKQYLKKVGDRTKQLALLRLGLELLREDLTNLRLAVSSRLLMAHIHRLPGVINRQFPGYQAAGLMHMIIRNETNVRKKRRKRAVQSNRKGPAR